MTELAWSLGWSRHTFPIWLDYSISQCFAHLEPSATPGRTC